MRQAPAIRATDDPPGLRIVDDIQGVETHLETPAPASIEGRPAEGFVFPVDAAVGIDADALRVPKYVGVIVRDRSGGVVAEASNRQEASVPPGRYVVQIESLEVKVYLAVEGGLETTTDDTGRIVRTSGDEFRIGVRSLHEYPGATLTTTDAPEDVMAALSAFGSALKTTSPERSWPTLRGHPPLVERGDRLDVPDAVADARDPSEITIEVPPDLAYVYPVASLAFYLNADVVPGDAPRLVAGRTHDLVSPDLETAAKRTLERVFLLDCVVRTEGLYPIDLAERRALERRIDLPWSALYDADLADRVDRYLEVPYDRLTDALPRWKTTADVTPTPAAVEHLPFIVADLGLIRSPDEDTAVGVGTAEPINSFVRGGARSDGGTRSSGTRSGRSTNADEGDPIVSLRGTDSMEHLWIGEGYPMQAAKPTVAARKRRLDARSSGDIDVTVVVNDPEMRAETAVSDLYGLRELVQFDVDLVERLDRAGLASLLAEDRDFVHFVGHVDERGLQCTDGYLDAAELDDVGARAFVLNACRSYAQGMHLVEAGAIAGVVTLSDIGNEPATKVGRMLARLLNAGFSLGGALDVLSSETVTGRQYSIVGDPNLALASSRGTPLRTAVERVGPDRFHVSVYGYPTVQWGLGSVVTPHVASNDRRYLHAGHVADYTITGDQLSEFLRLERSPVTVEGELRWSDELRAADFE